MAVIESVRYENGGVVVNGSVFIKATSIEAWINRLCLQKGATIEGRRRAFGVLTGQKQKVPVFVDEDTILVPLSAAGDLDGEWVNWRHDPARVPELTSRHIREFLRIISQPLDLS